MVDKTTKTNYVHLEKIGDFLHILGSYRKNANENNLQQTLLALEDYIILSDAGYVTHENEENVLGKMEFLGGILQGFTRLKAVGLETNIHPRDAKKCSEYLHELATIYSTYAFRHKEEPITEEVFGWGPTIRQGEMWPNGQ